jgi:hypothetical protein
MLRPAPANAYTRHVTWLASERREQLGDRKHGFNEGARFTLCGLPVAALEASPGTPFPSNDDSGFLCRECLAGARA